MTSTSMSPTPGPGQVRRPRRRKCLLKGCEKNFHPQQAAERYCREECRQKAREWSEWRAQQRYRASEKAKEKRKAQSRRYRERVRGRKEPEAVDEAARVISLDVFLMVSATGPGAIRGSSTARDHPGNASGSKPCRRAVERVVERERRWREPPTG